ncbi:MAG: ATP-binding protein [Acidobacteriota bacterium]
MKSPSPIPRTFWLDRLAAVWRRAPIVWLTGVRRAGKTTIGRQLGDKALFLNCDLPSTARRLDDPERFYASVEEPIVVFDEVHQLPDPSRLLKIGADEHPHLRILATGSSTLAATRKFRDALTGRKRTVHLLPVLHRELPAFGVADIERRLLHGGLPQRVLEDDEDPAFYAEWLDSYFARDVQELFRVEKRQAFLRLVELALRISGGQLEVTRLANHCRISRPTVTNYLDVLQVTHLVTLLRPFHGGGRREILQQPKIYAFDTGFVAYAHGWTKLRDTDRGLLWEHLVLETLQASGAESILYWRDKQKNEIDFVLPQRGGRCDAVECKWNSARFSGKSLRAFRQLHPEGDNYVITAQTSPPERRNVDEYAVVFCNLDQWEDGSAQLLVERDS